ncbi:MAG: hypothetical protein KDK76_04000 [Chlamydiia bacterium]|nr:hypothetical protein [Chlamydiia bacterium]
MYLIAILFSLLASSLGLKIEDVIAHENMQQEQDLSVTENLHDGKILILSDGSTWEVAPQSLSVSQTWIFPAPLNISKSTNTYYPYEITNIQTSSSILVRPITSYTPKHLDIQKS